MAVRSEALRVALIASIGSFIEWYDFLLAGTIAVIVWPSVVFSAFSPSAALALALVAFGISYFSRPLGAYIFGHYGDRLGRKSTLVFTLATMFVGTVGVALTPTAASAGILAAVLLNVFRLVQGVGLGGEWAGAITYTAEFMADSGRRGFWGSILGTTAYLGFAVSLLAVVGARLFLSPAAFMDWGWRALFLAGAMVLVVGAVIRYRFVDTPLFEEAKKKGTQSYPASGVLLRHPGTVVRLALAGTFITLVALMTATYAQSYLISLKVDSIFVSESLVAGFLAGVVFTVLGGIASDRFGRRKVLLASSLLTGLALYPYFLLLQTRSHAYIILAQVALIAVNGFGYGALPALLAESFPTAFRYSGTGLSYQLGNGLLVGIVLSLVVPYIIVASAGNLAWFYVMLLCIAFSAIGFASALFLRETRGAPLG